MDVMMGSVVAVRPLSGYDRTMPGGKPAPKWERPAVAFLLLGTLVTYLINLSASGWANPFYSAAAQAGSKSWTAFLFGSFDIGNAVTVDKPPAFLWPMDISVRIFGLNSWSILVPQALMGVATVGVLYAAVRRWSGVEAALIAGFVCALTPIAALMFRFNNPDALLALLMTSAVYFLIRAIEEPGYRWMTVVGLVMGLAFLTKMLQPLLIVPALAIAYLVAADTTLKRRFLHLLAAGGAMIVGAGWFIALVSFTPAQNRPYIGGSQSNSILDLIFGYNGLGRISGNEDGSVHLSVNTNSWGDVGPLRMWGSKLGGQVGWLLFAALVCLILGLWLRRKTGRLDRERAAYLLWGGWLIVTTLVFSYMQGIFHEYYTIAMAPALAALVGMGAVTGYRNRHLASVRWIGASTLLITGAVAFWVLVQAAYFMPALRWIIVAGAIVGAVGIVTINRYRAAVRYSIAALVAIVSLAGPAAYVANTVDSGYQGSIVVAGPSANSKRGKARTEDTPIKGQLPRRAGGLLFASDPSAALLQYLQNGDRAQPWLAAAVGSQRAAGYQLALGRSVMAIGGFNGSDPAPTLQQFKDLVAAGNVKWFIDGPPLGVGPAGGQVGGSRDAELIQSWIRDNFTSANIDGIDVYNLAS
ncbi:MAG: glycosyltransferase family 39 protein [Antricoccus sp.]